MKSQKIKIAYTAKTVSSELKKLGSPARAKVSAWFFKTGKGEYGEGDKFLGITVPVQRKVAHRFKELSFSEIKKLLQSPIHEHRFVALEILVKQYEEGDAEKKDIIFNFYLANAKKVNNWDLVDTSAPYILGKHLLSAPVRERKILYKLAKSENLWEKRIAIVATLALISQKQYGETLKIAELLINDSHDLIHKAVGWALREVGKKSLKVEEKFLNKHAHHMPRTMLRYAIERFPEAKRKSYLKTGKNSIIVYRARHK